MVVASITGPSGTRTRAETAVSTRIARRTCLDSQATDSAAPMMTRLYTVQSMFSTTVSTSWVFSLNARTKPNRKPAMLSQSKVR